MTRGRKLPVNSKVKRQLFPEDAPVERRLSWNEDDYMDNIVHKEYIARTLNNDIILKGMKWNFDFFTENPTSGRIKWYREQRTGQWVGMQPSGQSVSMRKRMKSGPSIYADERSKKRRLSQYTVAQRRTFFDDERALDCALSQCDNENFINELKVIYPVIRHPTTSSAPTTSQLNAEDSSATKPDLNSSLVKPKSKINDNDGTDEEEEKEGTVEEKTEELNEVNDDSNNVATEYDREMKTIDIESVNDGNKNKDELTKDNFENLRISDNTDTDMDEDKEELNDMKDINEITPKNTSNGPGFPKKAKRAKRRLNYRFEI